MRSRLSQPHPDTTRVARDREGRAEMTEMREWLGPSDPVTGEKALLGGPDLAG